MLQQGAGITRLVAVVRKGRNWHIIPSISISTLPYIIQCSARHEHHLPHQSPSPRVFSTIFFPYLVQALRNMAGNDNKGQFGRSPDVAMVLFMILLVVVVMTEFTMTVQARDAQSVTILNQLGAGGVLSLHCMSRDNDLGQQYLQPGENFGFSFHTNFWGTTQFWCTFGWNSHKDAFTVWRGPGFWRNHSQDCYQCLWYVRPEGFYRAQQGDPMTFVVPWDYSSF